MGRRIRAGYGRAKLFPLVGYMLVYNRLYRERSGVRQEEVHPIYFGTYNLRNGWNDGIEYALQGMLEANVCLGVLQETKATKGIYTKDSSGYRVVASKAPSAHSGGFAIFFRAADHFYVEALRLHVTNVVRFQLALVGQRWYIVGCYLVPDDASTTEDVVVAISQRPHGAVLSVAIYFNAKLAASEVQARDENIATDLFTAGL